MGFEFSLVFLYISAEWSDVSYREFAIENNQGLYDRV